MPIPALTLALTLAASPQGQAGATTAPGARELRRFAVLGEAGWNGLGGLGLNVSYAPVPYVAIDFGAGLSMAGFKAGLRVRGNLLRSNWTPTLGVGMLFTSGSADSTFDVPIEGEVATLRLRSAPFLQTIVGVSYVGDGGFTLLGTIGYAVLLGEHPAVHVAGSPRTFERVRTVYGSGLVLSAALGYAF